MPRGYLAKDAIRMVNALCLMCWNVDNGQYVPRNRMEALQIVRWHHWYRPTVGVVLLGRGSMTKFWRHIKQSVLLLYSPLEMTVRNVGAYFIRV